MHLLRPRIGSGRSRSRRLDQESAGCSAGVWGYGDLWSVAYALHLERRHPVRCVEVVDQSVCVGGRGKEAGQCNTVMKDRH